MSFGPNIGGGNGLYWAGLAPKEDPGTDLPTKLTPEEIVQKTAEAEKRIQDLAQKGE